MTSTSSALTCRVGNAKPPIFGRQHFLLLEGLLLILLLIVKLKEGHLKVEICLARPQGFYIWHYGSHKALERKAFKQELRRNFYDWSVIASLILLLFLQNKLKLHKWDSSLAFLDPVCQTGDDRRCHRFARFCSGGESRWCRVQFNQSLGKISCFLDVYCLLHTL